MTLTIELDESTETRLQEVARLKGTDPSSYVQRLLARSLPDDEDMALLRLFAEWDREDAALSEEELDRERAEWEEIRRNLDRRQIELRPSS